MWPLEKEVRAGVRQTRNVKPVKYQGYLDVIGPYGKYRVPVGPWRTRKGLALRDAKAAETRHRQMQERYQQIP